MSLIYRSGQPSDAGALAELFRQSFVETFGHLYRMEDLADFLAAKSPDAFRRDLADARYQFVVAEHEGKPVGYVKLGPPELPVETPPGAVELCQLYVLKEWHGRGVAQELMRRALEWGARQKARHVQLSVYIDNHRARRFYERYGFQPVGRYDFMVGSHADEDIVLRHIVLQANE